MKRIAASLGIVLLSFNMAVAHGGRLHVMGKVMSLDADHVVVKTRAGDTVSILLNDHTAYWKGKDKARLSDITAGTRVVIDLRAHSDPKVAEEIKMSSAQRRHSSERKPVEHN